MCENSEVPMGNGCGVRLFPIADRCLVVCGKANRYVCSAHDYNILYVPGRGDTWGHDFLKGFRAVLLPLGT